MHKIAEQVAENTRRLIEETGMPHHLVASELGITPDKLSKSLARPALRRFTVDEVVGLARLFKVPVAELLGIDERRAGRRPAR